MLREGLLSLVWGVVLTLISYAVAWGLGWEPQFSYLEFTGVVLNYACVFLTARQNMWCWPFGIAAVIALGFLFYNLELYSSMVLSVGYFLPVQLWGWYNWMYGGENKSTLSVSWLNPMQYFACVVFAVIAWFFVIILYQLTELNGSGGLNLDTGILVLSILAQFLLGMKKIESWFVWIVVNILSIYVYGTSGAHMLAFQYVIFLGHAFYGSYKWIETKKWS